MAHRDMISYARGLASAPQGALAQQPMLGCTVASALPPCSVIFCEAAAIYGVIVAIILQTKIESVELPADRGGLYPHGAIYSGYAILAAGLTTGLANLACGCVALPV
jgi:F0F1-type ATP synthase membrane subunit c/vacuolar-type H+-ATPase subunit K